MEDMQPKRKWGGLIAGAVFGLLCLSMMIAYGITGLSAMPDPVYYDPTSGETEYAYLEMQLLTECFAYSEENGEISKNFYFVLDSTGAPAIVQMSDKQFASHQTIVDFTYSDDPTAPDPVRITGIPRPLDDELLALSVEAFNDLWQGDYVTLDTAGDYFGSTYLDCTSDALQEAQANLIVFAFLFFVLSITLILMTLARNRRRPVVWPSPQEASEGSYQPFDYSDKPLS